MYNRSTMIGRACIDPILEKRGESDYCSFSLAVGRDRKNANGTYDADFFRVVTWNKLAEICSKYVKKGKLLLVEGRMQKREWADNEGQKKNSVELIANVIKFMPMQKNGNDNHQEQEKEIPIEEQWPDQNTGVNFEDLPF